MATEPLNDADAEVVSHLRAELDALRRRAHAAEERAESLARALEAERSAATAAPPPAPATQQPPEPAPLSLFEGPPLLSEPRLAGDGSDPGVLPIALVGTALVAAMVALLALVGGRFFSPVPLLMVVVSATLGWLAWRTRQVHVEVTFGQGVVYVQTQGSTYRFDVRSEATEIEVVGRPGDRHWEVRFLRRSMDPFVVDATMVDAHEFMRRLRAWRPEL